MTQAQSLQALTICDKGQLKFNKGKNLRSFLFQNKWYPLRACVNYAKSLNNEKELTSDKALVFELLVKFGLWTRVNLINNQTKKPIQLDKNEIAIEAKSLSKILYDLTK